MQKQVNPRLNIVGDGPRPGDEMDPNRTDLDMLDGTIRDQLENSLSMPSTSNPEKKRKGKGKKKKKSKKGAAAS